MLVRHGFATLGLKRLIALIHPQREASVWTAVRAGLRYEKDAEIEEIRSFVYAIEQA